jgi:predicted transcriptional regulator
VPGGETMKVKNIRIAIKSEKELFQEVSDVWEKASKGKNVRKREGLYFENLEAMRKVLTENRLMVLKTIRKEHPSSVYELAKLLKRDIKNTSDDVQFLTDVGLVELKKTKEGRERNVPTVSYEKILLEIPV